jgi:hypothetical protein
VARPQERNFLGFSFTAGPEVKRVVAPKALDRFKRRIREITRRAKGVSMKTTIAELASYMRGWRGYFGFCETPEVLVYLTRWVRLRLRAALWRQWKTYVVVARNWSHWECVRGSRVTWPPLKRAVSNCKQVAGVASLFMPCCDRIPVMLTCYRPSSATSKRRGRPLACFTVT